MPDAKTKTDGTQGVTPADEAAAAAAVERAMTERRGATAAGRA